MRFIIAALMGLTLASPVAAKAPLRDVKEIDGQMLNIALALEISEKCNEIDARTLKGLNTLWSLKRRANALGYSDDEINAYRKSKVEKARLRGLGEAYVKSKGLDPKSAADLCTLGRAEIKQGSVIGSLLKAK